MFRQLRVSIGNVAHSARPTKDVLLDLADVVSKFRDPLAAERAINQLGLSSSILPMLMQGRQGIEAYTRRVTRLWGSLENYAEASRRSTDATAYMGMAAEKLGMTIMMRLEPHLSPMLDRLSRFVEAHDHDIGQAFDRMGRAIEGVDWAGVGRGVESMGRKITSAMGVLDDFATRAERAERNVKRLIDIVQTPGRLWHEQFMRDADGVGRIDSNGYQIGDPNRLSGLDQAIALAGRYSRGEPGFEPASTSERIGRGRGPGLPLGPGAAPISNPEQLRRGRQGRDILVGLGWSPAQAAGIMANLDRESRLNEGAVGDSGQAYGVAQWHPDRRANIAAGMGRSVIGMSYEDQIRAVDYELRHTERAAGDALRRTTTAAEAGAAVSRFYERPRDTEGEAAARARSADFWDRHNPALPSSPTAQSNNGSSTVRIEIDHSNVPAGVNMRASTQGDGAEIGGIRVRRAMPDAGGSALMSGTVPP